MWLFFCGFLLEKSVFCSEICRFFGNSGRLSRTDVCILALVYYFVFQQITTSLFWWQKNIWVIIFYFGKKSVTLQTQNDGVLAQLARAFDWQSRGHRFDSVILHAPIKTKHKATTRKRVAFLFILFISVALCQSQRGFDGFDFLRKHLVCIVVVGSAGEGGLHAEIEFNLRLGAGGTHCYLASVGGEEL